MSFPLVFAVLPPVSIPWWAWVGFFVLILFVLSLDLGVFHKKDRVLPFREAMFWSVGWMSLAAVFGLLVWWLAGVSAAETFAVGYALELALSVDNLFVFLMVFAFFRVPEVLQHRVLFWGIIGAVFMRALFIAGGVALVEKFSFLMFIFGAFLVFTGIKMAIPGKEDGVDFEKNIFVRAGRKILPMTPQLRGHSFIVREAGRVLVTPLFFVLLVIEGTDVIFAVDSIPAVLGILPESMPGETRLFVAFTSNIFAILGLRSLFFALSGFMKFFRFLKIGLAVILGFIGLKMVLAEAGLIHISPGVSFGVLVGVLALAVAASVLAPEKTPPRLP